MPSAQNTLQLPVRHRCRIGVNEASIIFNAQSQVNFLDAGYIFYSVSYNIYVLYDKRVTVDSDKCKVYVLQVFLNLAVQIYQSSNSTDNKRISTKLKISTNYYACHK